MIRLLSWSYGNKNIPAKSAKYQLKSTKYITKYFLSRPIKDHLEKKEKHCGKKKRSCDDVGRL